MRKVLLAFLALTLAGCTSLPTTGPVIVGGPIGVELLAEVDYLPAGPSAGATQREILNGFIAAGASPQSNYRIARSFLTESAASTWNPVRETFVRGIYATVKTASPSSLLFSTAVSARVDERGVYQPSPSGSVASHEFGFQQVAGEWRLDIVPDLTLVTEVEFASAYDEFTVYFYNEDRTAFIPDVRIFARQGDPVTAVARAVIAGPSEYLPNASTAFPDGSALAVAPVEVSAGRAVVDVTDNARQASTTEQQEMLSQLGASLGAIAGISSTGLSVNRLALSVTAIPGIETNPRVDDRPLVVYDGEVGYTDGTVLTPVADNAARIVNLNPTSVSFDSTTNAVAVGTRVGVYLFRDRTEQISSRPSLVDPQMGGANSVWWVSTESPNAISASTDGVEITVQGPWPKSARIVGLEVSREDSRLAVAVDQRGRSVLYVAAISVDDAKRPQAVGGFRPLPVAADSIIDLAWSDATHVAVLARKNGVVYAEVATVGGRTELVGQPQNPARISGGNSGNAGLVVIARNGQLWTPRGTGWQSTGIPADVLATQR
jgi:hypothetical protein